jgi:hypothetical protein
VSAVLPPEVACVPGVPTGPLARPFGEGGPAVAPGAPAVSGDPGSPNGAFPAAPGVTPSSTGRFTSAAASTAAVNCCYAGHRVLTATSSSTPARLHTPTTV